MKKKNNSKSDLPIHNHILSIKGCTAITIMMSAQQSQYDNIDNNNNIELHQNNTDHHKETIRNTINNDNST